MDKRYQVFISSTFADLQDERAKVQQTIMELDCIPAGMEIFPAIDEEQFEFIKKVIDDCDYYLLIIGGRYGSVSEEGVSYTEMEYDYAVSKEIKVIAFLHKAPESLPFNKSEQTATARKKLAAFRDKAATSRLVKFWENANELPGLVALSLSKTIRTYPAIGWVRADSAVDPQIYKELNDLRRENQELKESVQRQPVIQSISDLAGLDEVVTLHGEGQAPYNGRYVRRSWEANVTWGQVFGLIAPDLLSPQPDAMVAAYLAPKLKKLSNRDEITRVISVDNSDYQTIKLQLKALGLVQLISANNGLVWELTEAGEKVMYDLRTVRTSQSPTAG